MTAVFMASILFVTSPADALQQRSFGSPEEAANVLVETVKAKDTRTMVSLFGKGSQDLVTSGDPVSDNARFDSFVRLYEEKNKLQEESDGKVLLFLGNEGWPFPIPIVKQNERWYFDANEGRDEILARRIGKNELNAIQVCLAVVDAQREYAVEDRNDDSLLEYAQKLSSDPGQKNGLFWKVKEGEKQSPLGPLAAAAVKEGYSRKNDKPAPYHGYYYRILKAQGENASGGAYDYTVRGKMIGGFALVAYPAKYASSGIMTFIMNHDGIVYQRDLGPGTAKIAAETSEYDPGPRWKRVEPTR